MRNDLESREAEPAQTCLNLMNFFQNWEEWRSSLSETVRAAREIDPSDRHTVEVVEDMIDFLAKRTCPGTPEERLIREMWDRAEPTDREALARIFIRML
jgi:sulfur relay (sulfurtransferase) DsrC/TusE family protein